MFKLKEICTCNHCLKTCEGIHEIDKSKWFHFRKKLNDEETDLTNSVDFCPDCAKLLTEELRKYNGAPVIPVDSLKGEIHNSYRHMYLDIYASAIMYLIKMNSDEASLLMHNISLLPGKVTVVDQTEHNYSRELKLRINDEGIFISINGTNVTLKSYWREISHQSKTTAISKSDIVSFLDEVSTSTQGTPLFRDCIMPHDHDAFTVSFLLSTVNDMADSFLDVWGEHLTDFFKKLIERIKSQIVTLDIIRERK